MATARAPQDRQPARPRVRRSTTAEIDQAGPAQAEVDGESLDGDVTVTLAGKPLTVLRPGSWRSSANSALREGDYELWAEKVLSPKDFQTWLKIDPTNDQVNEFLAQWGELVGMSLGDSKASARSSRSTRRR